ncbi:MAG: tyrosine--tRNA ligase 2 [Phycisphaerae bacterium]|nr:MAG: tyrosine--tRNA ligase 2 [Phycisphaerae bacterium]
MTDFISELQWRGRLAQCTDETGLRKHLATGTRRCYIGFDPTADSLTVGNLVQIITLALVQRSGHVPVVVVGGGTGLIGDPSGKTAERTLRTRDEVNANVESQKRIYDRILDFSAGAKYRAILLNNADWLCELSYLDALRDIGKHFSVNMMIQKDSVRERLHNRDQGISYTEFSYMILQAYDFLHLYEKHGVTIQSGGSDQWGNIVAGTDLVRKKHAADGESSSAESFGLTTQLITKSDGGKFGKTESGAIWLTANRPGESAANRTSPYAFYQFWLNTADADIPKFLRTFTLLSHADIESLEATHAAIPGQRDAHRALARHMTTLLHGETETQHAESAAKALFSGEIASLPADLLTEVLASAPSTSHDKATLSAGIPLVDLLVTTQLAQSKREAKEFLQGGSVTLNGRKVGPDDKATTADLLHGSVIALRRGKKAWHVTRWA